MYITTIAAIIFNLTLKLVNMTSAIILSVIEWLIGHLDHPV